MKKKNSIGQWILIILMWVLVFAVGFVYGIILIKYGNKPISEVPVWVLWWLGGK